MKTTLQSPVDKVYQFAVQLFLVTIIKSENIHINIEIGSLFKYLDDYINKSLFE